MKTEENKDFMESVLNTFKLRNLHELTSEKMLPTKIEVTEVWFSGVASF